MALEIIPMSDVTLAVDERALEEAAESLAHRLWPTVEHRALEILGDWIEGGTAQKPPQGDGAILALPTAAPVQLPLSESAAPKRRATSAPKPTAAPTEGDGQPGRVRGVLQGAVRDYVKANGGAEGVTSTQVSKALGKSSGAVGNALIKLASDGTIVQTSETPRRYAWPKG